MTKEIRSSNVEKFCVARTPFSSLGFRHSFGFRHSSFGFENPSLRLVLCLLNDWCFVAPGLACGEARGGSIPRGGAVTDEQRRHRPDWSQPFGRQVLFAQTSLLAPYRPTLGYARRSRLVWAKNPLPRTSPYLCS